MKKTHLLLALAASQGIIRASDLEAHGISRVFLHRLCALGELERVGRGIYALTDHQVTKNHTLALAARYVPHGIVALLSALQFHGLTTQLPSEIWLAIDRSARKPRIAYPPLRYPPIRIVRFSGVNLTHGVEEHHVEGVLLHVTSKAKTVADCFKYRHKLGLDVAMEALRDFAREGGSMDELWRAAKACRVAHIMRPYMESIV